MLVEREVVAEGLTRKGMGREKFLKRVWEYKNKNAGAIVGQMRRLGASADWSKERFTLEPDMNDAVRNELRCDEG
jgi:valyl-tRNA synthetase